MMNSDSIKFALLFDADEYYRSGCCPWTFFAYPTSLAIERGLPPDSEACRLIAELQQRGIDVAIWVSGVVDNTTYFACRKEDIQRLNVTLDELEASRVIEKGFCANRSERLFAERAEGRERIILNGAAENADYNGKLTGRPSTERTSLVD